MNFVEPITIDSIVLYNKFKFLVFLINGDFFRWQMPTLVITQSRSINTYLTTSSRMIFEDAQILDKLFLVDILLHRSRGQQSRDASRQVIGRWSEASLLGSQSDAPHRILNFNSTVQNRDKKFPPTMKIHFFEGWINNEIPQKSKRVQKKNYFMKIGEMKSTWCESSMANYFLLHFI